LLQRGEGDHSDARAPGEAPAVARVAEAALLDVADANGLQRSDRIEVDPDARVRRLLDGVLDADGEPPPLDHGKVVVEGLAQSIDHGRLDAG
jgi:hypothetical protein